MQIERRLFIRRAAGSAAVFGTGLFSFDRLFGQQQQTNAQRCQAPCPINGNPPPCTAGALCNLSAAVVQDATATFITALNKAKAGTVQATDLASASTAAQMLFDNLQEAGIYSQITQQAQACTQNASCPVPLSSSQLNQLYQQLLADGANVTLSDVQSVNITGSQLTAAASSFQSQGGPALANSAVQGLHNSAQVLQSSGQVQLESGSFCDALVGFIFFLRAIVFDPIGGALCPDCVAIGVALLALASLINVVYCNFLGGNE